MFNRKRLDRERLEIYLAQLLLAYRLFLLLGGMLMFIYSLAVMIRSFLMGTAILLMSLVPLLLALSYPFVVLVARLVASIVTLGNKA